MNREEVCVLFRAKRGLFWVFIGETEKRTYSFSLSLYSSLYQNVFKSSNQSPVYINM